MASQNKPLSPLEIAEGRLTAGASLTDDQKKLLIDSRRTEAAKKLAEDTAARDRQGEIAAMEQTFQNSAPVQTAYVTRPRQSPEAEAITQKNQAESRAKLEKQLAQGAVTRVGKKSELASAAALTAQARLIYTQKIAAKAVNDIFRTSKALNDVQLTTRQRTELRAAVIKDITTAASDFVELGVASDDIGGQHPSKRDLAVRAVARSMRDETLAHALGIDADPDYRVDVTEIRDAFEAYMPDLAADLAAQSALAAEMPQQRTAPDLAASFTPVGLAG